MHPTQQDVAAVAVLISEYRNGQIIGTVMRDMQLYIIQCTNTVPTVTGVDSTSNYSIASCAGSQFCFTVVSNDVDPNQVLEMTNNVSASIPGATFSILNPGAAFPTGEFCWTPTQADAGGHDFVVTVRDNACPVRGTYAHNYHVDVSNMGVTLTSTPSVNCHGDHNGSAQAIATGIPPLTYTWMKTSGSGPPFFQTGTTASATHLYGGTYTLNVIDDNNCIGNSSFTIAEPAVLTAAVSTVNSGCSGSGAAGSATASPTGGTTFPNPPDYHYLWNDPLAQTTQTASNLSTGYYTVLVTDAHGCTTTQSDSIVSVVPIVWHISSSPASCLANDGSASVTHTGGIGPYSYVWTRNGVPYNSTSANLQNIITGNYVCHATDLGTGCDSILPTTVANLSGFSATITAQTDATCDNSSNGSATVQATGGQLPYTYLWPNGDTVPTTNSLDTGTHTVVVTDYNGCVAMAMVTIGYQHASPVVDLGPDSAACTSTGMTLFAGACTGCTYLWSDLSTLDSLHVVAPGGLITVLVTDANGCTKMDAVNISFLPCIVAPGGQGGTHFRNAFVRIYPNPANNELNLYINNVKDADVTITLTDVLGNAVYFNSEKANYSYSKKIDIHSLSQGIYIMKIESNGEVSTSRIVKQ
jgi:hypothetical protein